MGSVCRHYDVYLLAAAVVSHGDGAFIKASGLRIPWTSEGRDSTAIAPVPDC
ncbi:hypothetical protein D3C85_1619630 [compost metagenome]